MPSDDISVISAPSCFGKDVDELRRASGSVPYNIAEASGSEQIGKKVNHLEIARGSAGEVRAVLRRLVRLDVLTTPPILRAWIAKLQ